MTSPLRSASYPDFKTVNKNYRTLHEQHQVIQAYKHKDHVRTENLASLGSSSSLNIRIKHNWKERCCRSVSKLIDYFLEREEEAKKQDEYIQSKSYAGFFYFIKWFVRSFFFLVFTTLGSIAGKEIGCEIKDHATCHSGLFELVESSPHIESTILGALFGLLLGQWLGRVIWDTSTKYIGKCLRKIEKIADRTKAGLIILSFIVYIFITTGFSLIFLFFVDIGFDKKNVLGGIVGGIIGLLCAIFAYRKKSSCTTGQQTPHVRGEEGQDIEELRI